jgi:hypothetical protein
LTGYIGESRYFCRECYVEFKMSRKNVRVYDVLKDGRAVPREGTNKVDEKKYHGIRQSKNKQRWYASIAVNGMREHIGVFDTEIEAAKAYNQRAKELLGNKAKLNYIGG